MMDFAALSQTNLKKIDKTIEIILDAFEIQGNRLKTEIQIPFATFEAEGITRFDVEAIINKLDIRKVKYDPMAELAGYAEIFSISPGENIRRKEKSDDYLRLIIDNVEQLTETRKEIEGEIISDEKPVELQPEYKPETSWQDIQKEMREASFKQTEENARKRRHRELLKQNRMLACKDDRYIHAIKTIIERVENSHDKTINISFYYFNFEDRMDDLRLLSHFLNTMKEAGCFNSFEKHMRIGGTDLIFSKVNIENTKTFLKEQLLKQQKDNCFFMLNFDPDKNILTIKGKDIKIKDHSDQCHLLKIIFKDQNELTKEWFFSEISERYDQMANLPDKKFYNATYQLNGKIHKETGIKDFLLTNSQSFKINPDHLQS